MMFNEDLIDLILVGRKTTTRRSQKIANEGDITNLMANRDYSKLTQTYIRITNVYQQKLGDMTDIDAQKEGFQNLSEFISYWNTRLKPRNSWNPNLVIWVHDFVLY